MERPSNTTLALLGGVGLLIIMLIVFAATRNSEQDRIGDTATFSVDNPDLNRACSGQIIYEQIKRALFQEALKLRGKDDEAYRSLANVASIRMENPAAEGEGRSPGVIDCAGSMAIDLPPGITTAAGRRLLMSDVYYAVDPDNRRVVQLRNADQIVGELAGLTVSQVPQAAPPLTGAPAEEGAPIDPLAPIDPGSAPPMQAGPPVRPSYDCGRARTNGERMVCADPGLADLDRAMAAEYGRAVAQSSPQQQAILRQTRDRFLAYRDNCPNAACIGAAYNDRIREIRDIATGRWQPPR